MTGNAWSMALVILGTALFFFISAPALPGAREPLAHPLSSASPGAHEASPSPEAATPSPDEASPTPAAKEKSSDEGAWLDETPGGPVKEKEIRQNLMKRIWLTLFSLVLVSIIIYVMLKFVYSRQGILPGLGSRNKMIKVMERHILQPSKALYLVDVAGKYVLLGITEQRIEYIMEVEGEKLKELSTPPEEGVAVPQNTFGGQLATLYGKWIHEKKK
jgi:flagellar biogenesis protein FliO